jgi:hypothetical protein
MGDGLFGRLVVWSIQSVWSFGRLEKGYGLWAVGFTFIVLGSSIWSVQPF